MKKLIFIQLLLLSFALQASQATFSRQYFEAFSNTAILQENNILANGGFKPVPPLPPDPPAPPNLAGYALFQVVNNTTHPDSDVYLIVKGLNSDEEACYLSLQNGLGDYALVSPLTLSSTYSYPLSSLPGKTGHRYFYVPQPFISARVYFSMNYPLLFAVGLDNQTQKATIVDPSSFSPSDPNYYTLYDKFEFTYNPPTPGANLYVNPTAVDFFSLPIYLEMANALPGSLAESGINLSRSSVFQDIDSIFNPAPADEQWKLLSLPFYVDPYATTPTELTELRVVSPGNASAPGSTAVNPSHAFPSDYLSNAATYGFDYIDNLWSFYAIPGNTLRIDAKEIAIFFGPGPDSPSYPDYYYFSGVVNGSDQFVFTNYTNDYTWTMEKPTSCYPFFAGAGFVDSGSTNNTPGAIIVRQLTSGFDVGLLPVNFAMGSFLDKSYFEANKSNYYTSNPQWGNAGADNGPFYDLYSKALHSFGFSIYTFAYDDALGQDGTLIGNVETLQSSVTVTLPPVDTPIPDPFADNTVYTVTIQAAGDNPVQYRNSVNGEWIDATSVPFGGIVSNQTTPFQLKLKNNRGIEDIVTLYLKYNIVVPSGTDFSLSSGIVITHTTPPETHVLIQTPGL